jgi:predicted alternative tryptophan synthase beta-subunit
MNIDSFTIIEKEMVSTLHFPAGEVITESIALNARKTAIERALAMGNLEHQKVKIYFKDENNLKQVETTIWGVTDTVILLKKNVLIPIERIVKLEI